MSRKTKPELGYLMSEDLHSQIMRGIDSLRFLEGLLCTAINAPVTPCFDLDDLVGYLQLLLENTYKPMKSMEYQRWAPADNDGRVRGEENDAVPDDDETELLREYRNMSRADRLHFRRVSEALVFSARPEVCQ